MAIAEVAGSVLAAAFIGSPHCAGMCGGFVCFVSGEASGPRRWLAQAAYHGGRLLSYLLLGAAAGALGAGIERAGASAGVGRAAPIGAGILMLAWGGARLAHAMGVGSDRAGTGVRPGGAHALASRLLAPAMRALRAWHPTTRGLAIGILTTLIPCGFLYAFVAIAAGTGSPAGGLLVMGAFWVGTVPVLAALGVAADRAVGVLRLRLPVLSALLLIVLGLLTLAGRLRPIEGRHHHTAAMPAAAAPAIPMNHEVHDAAR